MESREVLAATFRARVEKRQAREVENHRRWAIVRGILERFQGKPLNKRVKTAIEKEQPGWTVYLEGTGAGPHFSSVWLHIWGDGIDYNNRIHMHIGAARDHADGFSLAVFDAASIAYGSAAARRIEARRDFLASDRPEEIADLKIAQQAAQARIDVLMSFDTGDRLDSLKYDIENDPER